MRAGLSKAWQRVRSAAHYIFTSRVILMGVFFCVLAIILIQRLFTLQIVNGQEYNDNYKLQIQKTKEVEGTRGNIYDRNGTLLAYNDLAYTVTIEDSGEYDSQAEKNEVLNEIITTVINIVESNGDSIINDFNIVLDEDNSYQFTSTSRTQQLRFIADVYGLTTIDKLTEEQQNETPQDIITYLCTDPTYGYGIDENAMSKEDVLKLVNVRYAISLNSYQKYIETTVAEDVSEETVSEIMENKDELTGVDISDDSVRRYIDSNAFANVVGYTGKISEDEYEELSEEEQEEYDLTDTIGKAGIEKTMDSYLRAQKGSVKVYVNNVGKVIETVEEDEAGAGDDVYLTLDADLQQASYDILEQELAGIILSQLVNSLEFDSSAVEDTSAIKIPVGDVYNAIIGNNMVDAGHFSEEDAGKNEKEIYKTFSKRKNSILEDLTDLLKDPDGKTYKKLSNQWQSYMTYIVTDLLQDSRGVIMADAVNVDDDTYKDWHDKESINVYTYLNYAISKNWVDVSKLSDYMPENEEYSDAGEIYDALCNYTIDALSSNNTTFDKMIYRYLIKSGKITGQQLCMTLYEQGVLDKKDNQYNRLKTGDISAYDFVRAKIETLEITPGDLALEPCTGSLVMTDTHSGDVLVCVSYPGYDNNRLANDMDSSYYNKLVTDGSRPLYNNATQERTAPGSTYKPLMAVAGVSEGVIDVDSTISCTGLFEEVGTPHKCWIYPSSHGGLNLSQAIEESCNYYFYTVGYRMSLRKRNNAGGESKSTYSSPLGTDTIRKYAEQFGLGETSGVEIPESDPQISDESSVPTAIGQGNNNYTTTQLARYVTAIANRGTVYQLTLLDKVTDPEGDTVKEYEPVISDSIDYVAEGTWDAIQEGMRNVVRVAHSKVFTSLTSSGVELSGKTGTAQQSASHPDHGLFIGYAPSDSPDIAFATRIANGYSSSRAAEVGRDVMKYYYETEDVDQIITGRAAELSSGASVGD